MRKSGILMPVFSLPSKYGIGSFGKSAYNWVDFLVAAKQSCWQVLPLCPTSYGDSPYQSFSAFAGNPYFIDLDTLQQQNLLTEEECRSAIRTEEYIDYADLFATRFTLLHKAYQRFSATEKLDAFCADNRWVEEYALYMAIKEANAQEPWSEWTDEGLRLHHPEALRQAKDTLSCEIRFHCYLQYEFFRQWQQLKQYANQNGVEIIGDMPIYVAMDSADVWANSHLFLLDENKVPIEVAGCPPDAFSADGQLWGNPLYRWDVLAQDGYSWWLKRMDSALKMYDTVRIDHFRGLESYYAIPYGSSTARNGVWRKGPDIDFIRTLQQRFGTNGVIAEDLGFLTPAVHQLLEQSGYPGMKVLQFAFDSREESDYLPHNYTNNCVVYTGTHDNDTLCGWFEHASPEDIAFAQKYLGITESSGQCWAMIRLALASVANLAIIPMQDYLQLGSSARINTPATLGGNWVWRMQPQMISDDLSQKIADITTLYGRAKRKQGRG